MLVIFHYTLWRKVLEKISNQIIAPDKHNYGVNSLKNKVGTIKEIEKELYVEINDEIYSFNSDEEFVPGDKAKIINYSKENNQFTIKKQ
jgi:membrane protein implicated in regulation of membrane protease activity